MATIKQITVGSTTYDLTGKYLLDSQGNEKSWEDITELVEAGFDLVVLNNLPYPTSSTTWDDIYAEYHNDIILVPQETPGEDNNYDEYVIQKASLADATSYSLPSQYSKDVLFTILGAEPPTSYETIYEDSYSNSVSVKFDNANAKGIIKHTVSDFSIYYVYSLQSRSGDWYSDEAGTTPYTGILQFNYHKPNIYEDFTRLFAFVSGSNDAYAWEKIGSTDVDLSNYVEKGTYTTDAPSTNTTSSNGAGTYTTSSNGEQTASGQATVTYVKSATVTGSAGATGTSANTGKAASVTIQGSSFSFSGTSVTLSQSINYTPEGSVEIQAVGTHSHTVNVSSLTAGNTVSVVTGVGANGTTKVATEGIKNVSLTGTQTFVTGAISDAALSVTTTSTSGYQEVITSVSASTLGGDTTMVKTVSGQTSTMISTVTNSTGTFMASATVNSGVLSFTTATAVSAVTATTVTGLTGVTSTSGTVSINSGTVTKKYVKVNTTAASTASVGITYSNASTATALTGVKASGTTNVIKSLPAITVSQVSADTITSTLNGTAKTINVSINYTPGGSITGSATVPEHSHTYTAPADHTHTIATSTASATGTASVAVSAHTHTVTTSSHTHDLGNHTHDITFS